jgi:phospholipase/lecithinase/hemolysin
VQIDLNSFYLKYVKEVMMKKIIFLLSLLFCCSHVFAGPINKIVFFGDSLSDNGNLYKLLLTIFPKSPPYFQGRFSNGPTWAEDVGKYYADHDHTDYKIYALGGATTISHPPSATFIAPTTLKLELSQYEMDTLFKDKSKTLFAIWISGNDYLFDPYTDVNKVVGRIAWVIETLINEGGRHFLVLNLPDLSRIPLTQHDAKIEQLHWVTQSHNKKLAEAMQNLKNAHADINLTFVNVFDIFNDLIDNPQKYNEKYHIHITDTKSACWQGGYTLKKMTSVPALSSELQQTFSDQKWGENKMNTDEISHFILHSPSVSQAYTVGKWYEQGILPCSNPNAYLFWDQIHPTGLVHQMLSQIVIQNLTATMS